MQLDAALEGMYAQDGRHGSIAQLRAEAAAVRGAHPTPSIPGLHRPPPEVASDRAAHGDDELRVDALQQAVQVAVDALVYGLIGHQVGVCRRATDRPGVEREVHPVM